MLLLVTPPAALSYFNAGHRLALYQTSRLVRDRGGTALVRDYAGLRLGWHDVCTDLARLQPSVVAVFCDFDGIDGLPRLLRYLNELAPAARVLLFGRVVAMAPRTFSSLRVDAILSAGDPEPAIAEFVLRDPDRDTRLVAEVLPERSLDASELVLPELAEIPYADYAAHNSDDLRKYCGVPHRLEVVVPIARGCPYNCAFCDVPVIQGRAERRLSVERTLSYLDEAVSAGFDYASFYCPTFTLKRGWVQDLCVQLADFPRLPWKCVTTPDLLSPELVAQMSRAGCFRISIGLESLEPTDQVSRAKWRAATRVEEISRWCKRVDIELNCFIIAGLPGSSVAGLERSIAQLMKLGVRIRPTIYCDYGAMRSVETLDELMTFNRQLVERSADISGLDRQRLYRIVYANENDTETRIQRRIPSQSVLEQDGLSPRDQPKEQRTPQ